MPNVYDANKCLVKIEDMEPGTVFIGSNGGYFMVSDESCGDTLSYIRCMNLTTGVLHDMFRTDEREVFEGKLIMEC